MKHPSGFQKHELCQRYCANFAGLETDNKQHGFFKD